MPDSKPDGRPSWLPRILIGAGILAVVAVGVIGFRLWIAYSSIETEQFDPTAAAEALAERVEVEEAADAPVASVETPPAVLRLPGSYQRALEAEAAEMYLIDVLSGVRRPLPPVPQQIENAASAPLPDDMFDAYLLIGSDLSGSRADAIILGLIPSDGSAPIIASIPRDLYLTNPCTGSNDRINAALTGCPGYATGGELVALAVRQFTGIEVDHFVGTSFEGFASVIDALGGVELCVEAPTRDEKAHFELQPGCHQADGELALAWARSRRTEELQEGEWQVVAGNDFTRQQKQQEILFKVAGRVASFSSLGSFSSVVQEIANAIRLDTGFSLTEALGLAWHYRGIDPSEVLRVEMAFENYRAPSGAEVLLPIETFNEALARVYPPAAA